MPPARKPILCYVTDRRAFEAAPAAGDSSPRLPSSRNAPPHDPAAVRDPSLHDAIRRAVAAGADWIQIREKDLDARALMELARFAKAAARETGTRILINDRLDVARVANVSGVHLGEKSLPLEAVSEWRHASGRRDFQIGVSCHSLESAREAARGGADYIFFGPVFETPSKAAFGAPQGLERLREICASVETPVLAIGGINFENARVCLAVGATGIAAIRLFQDAENAAELAARLASL